MSDTEENIFDFTPPELDLLAQNASECTLPEKSKNLYMSAYEDFLTWKTNKNAVSFSEKVLLAYFYEMSTKYKPSTLWSKFSMIKSILKIKNNVDVSKYATLAAFLKRKSDGFQSKKSKILTSNDIERFLNEAPDDQYLATKVRSYLLRHIKNIESIYL